MDFLEKILRLREEKGWSEYKLSAESGVPQSTISSWYRKKVQPSVESLQAVCSALGITLSELFAERSTAYYPSPLQLRLLDGFDKLEGRQQTSLVNFLESFNKK